MICFDNPPPPVLTVVPCGPGKLVALTYEESANLLASPLLIDSESAGFISVAVLGVWSIGYFFRILIRMVNAPEVHSDQS